MAHLHLDQPYFYIDSLHNFIFNRVPLNVFIIIHKWFQYQFEVEHNPVSNMTNINTYILQTNFQLYRLLRNNNIILKQI